MRRAGRSHRAAAGSPDERHLQGRLVGEQTVGRLAVLAQASPWSEVTTTRVGALLPSREAPAAAEEGIRRRDLAQVGMPPVADVEGSGGA